jgi:O-antigen/teichoic acid export membrane protein
MTAEQSQAAARRSRGIVLAVLTSILSKGGNILLILLAIPLAYRVLGEERAAIYGVMQSLMWLVSMSDLGTGPGMVRRLAAAAAARDRAQQSAIVSTGFFLSTGLVLLLSGVLALLMLNVPLTSLFGSAFAAHTGELRTAAWTSLGIFTAGMILASIERVREGWQEIHVNNMIGGAYNVTAAAVLWAGISVWPQPVFVIIAVYGVFITFSCANAGRLLWMRPWLAPRLRHWDPGLARSMAGEGMALFIAGSVAPILVREAPKFLLSRSGHDTAAADITHYWILVQLGFLGMGVVMMLTRPLWPALAEASHRGDHAWITAARRRMLRWFAPAAVLALAGFSLAGPWFTTWWLGTGGGLTRSHFTLYGVIFVLTAWSQLHYVMLGSMGRARTVAWVLAAETVAVLILTWAGINMAGLDGALQGTALGMALLSAWLLPFCLQRALRRRGLG